MNPTPFYSGMSRKLMEQGLVPDETSKACEPRTRFEIFRRIAFRFLFAASIVLFISAIAVDLTMWWSAWRMDFLPDAWGAPNEPHGPWRRAHAMWGYTGLKDLPSLWTWVLKLLSLSSIAGFIALFAKRNWKRVLLPLVSWILGILFFYTHYWLVD